jgi:T5SS/PEP-CTERM-associated repeat protein
MGNSLVVSNGGRVSSGTSPIAAGAAFVGDNSANNSVLVSDPGSTWRIQGPLYIGTTGGRNSLVIRNGGQVIGNESTYLGYHLFGTNNSVLVSDPSSVWTNGYDLYVGRAGSYNSMVITNGSQVVNASGFLGSSSSFNNVRVSDGGVWKNYDRLFVGNTGSSNLLFVAGGSVFATNLIVGVASSVCNNLLRLDNGSVIVTNAAGNAVFEIRRGKLILSGGTLQVDRFVMTNACAQFVRTGGELIYGVAVLDPSRDDDGDGIPNGWEQSHGFDPLNAVDANVDTDHDGFTNLEEFQAGTDPTNLISNPLRVKAIAIESNDARITWTTAGGLTNVVQAADGGGDASYTNGFTDISGSIIVPGLNLSTTNYLDVGGATNLPARYYRVRLVP